MGFVLSILYFVISYLTPEALLGSFAQYHVQLIIAVLTLLASIPRLLRSSILKSPQSLGLLGLALAAFLSTLVGMHWIGGAVNVFIQVFSTILAFFFICLHFDTRKRLKVLVAVLFFVSVVVILHGVSDLRVVSGSYGPPISPQTGSVDLPQWDVEHPYLFPMNNNKGEWFYRIRGLGMINDPNDFAQLLVCIIPLMFIFWRPKQSLGNLAFVIVPVLVLIVGVFLTHSRGALLALTAIATVAGRRRIGTVPSVVLACCLFIVAMATQFSGGLDISASAGEDRTALWGESIAVLRTHPIFGVGFENRDAIAERRKVARQRQRCRPRAHACDTEFLGARNAFRQARAHPRFDTLAAIVGGDAFQAADGHRLVLDAPAAAGRLARPVAGAAENAREDVGLPVDHVGVGVPAFSDQSDVFGNWCMGRTGPLAIDDLVEVVVTNLTRALQNFGILPGALYSRGCEVASAAQSWPRHPDAALRGHKLGRTP